MLSIEKQLALAVLQDDYVAALALADRVQEKNDGMIRQIVPIIKIISQGRPLQAIVYVKDGVEMPEYAIIQTRDEITRWLNGEVETLLLVGVDRVEVYAI